jgi:hypothetical protein
VPNNPPSTDPADMLQEAAAYLRQYQFDHRYELKPYVDNSITDLLARIADVAQGRDWSIGHLAFYGDREYWTDGRDVYRAPMHNAFDVRTGRRHGHWECPLRLWDILKPRLDKAEQVEVWGFQP